MEQVGAGPPKPESATFVLEEKKRLSNSLIWRLQRDFYGQKGEEAWLTGRTPFYVTSNAFIASAYARVIAGFLRDCAGAKSDLGPLDPKAPVYILEVAAGSGKFGFLFLKKLLALKQRIPLLAGLNFRYVMTDLVPANLKAWRSRERFRPFLEAGVLDFATFDLERDEKITLTHSGETLSAETLRNPLAVIANYAFDTTVQDAFWIKGGALQESLVTTASTRKEQEGLPDPETLKRVSTRYEQRPVEDDYYEDEAMNRILAAYRTRLGDTSFLFPIGALKGIRTLMAMASGRLLLLSGDKGYTHEDELTVRSDPQMALHGGFSMMVNYHAIGLYFRERGGLALHSSSRDKRLKVSAFLTGAPEAMLAETRSAFHQAIDGFGPCEYFTLVTGLRKELPAPSLDVLLGLLRIGEGDPHLISLFSVPLADHAKKAPDPVRREVVRVLEQAWDYFYPMDHDLPFELGRIYSALERPLDALRCYLESLRLYKEHPATLFNAGLCLYRLQRPQEALTLMERALKVEEGYGPAREWRIRLQSELAGR
jgi:tetratricopeptide (TPR) repeat protein